MKKCLPLFHSYGLWMKENGGTVEKYGLRKGFWELQVRVCSKCGKKQLKLRET